MGEGKYGILRYGLVRSGVPHSGPRTSKRRVFDINLGFSFTFCLINEGGLRDADAVTEETCSADSSLSIRTNERRTGPDPGRCSATFWRLRSGR